MTVGDLFFRFGAALALGLLIGLEREFKHVRENESTKFAGVRTFALIALIGCAAAMLGDEMGTPWVFVFGFVGVTGIVIAAYITTAKQGSFGITTESACLLTALIGALCFYDQLGLAVALTVATMLLLSAKVELQRFTRTLTQEDIVAVVQFGIVTAIVLPILPDEPIGAAPFDVLTPRKVWLMVVLVSGLGFIGYGLNKFMAGNKAIALTGFLGGLVSSTAVTLTFSQRSREVSILCNAFAVAIVIAWVTMFVRVIVEVLVVNQPLAGDVWIPMTAAAVAGGLYCYFLYRKGSSNDGASEDVEMGNPFSLGKAVTFGAVYALVLVVARAAQMYFGDQGIYVSAIATGLADVDAITLSMAELSQPGGSVSLDVATRAITLAAVSNTVVKAGIVFATGHALLKRAVWPGFLLISAAGLAAAFTL